LEVFDCIEKPSKTHTHYPHHLAAPAVLAIDAGA